MEKALKETQKDFESSSQRTPEYLQWHRLFKKEFTSFLKERKAENIDIGNPNHFDMSGFFDMEKQIYYFSVGDLRWDKAAMLVRTAETHKDYTGGSNCFISLDLGATRFQQQFDTLISPQAAC